MDASDTISGRSLQAWLDRADELAGCGRFFDAHEELEIPWKAARGETKILLQGLVQIAAGLHRLRLQPGKTDGAQYLLERGVEKIRRASSLITDESRDAFIGVILAIRAARRGPGELKFGLRVE